MNKYRVDTGPAQIGPGTVIGLTAKQYADRKHNLELVVEEKSGIIVAKPTSVQHFKVGEEILLEDLPKNLVEVCVPVGRPKSETDRLAKEMATGRKGKAEAEEKSAPTAEEQPQA